MKSTDLQFRVRTTTGEMLVKQRYYDDTFLKSDDGGTVLFILDAALVRFPSGIKLRTKRDVLDFPTEAAMLGAVVAGGWEVAPLDGDPQWKPVLRNPGSSDGPNTPDR